MFANLVEEAGKMGGYVLECFVVPLVRIAAVAHGANEALRGAASGNRSAPRIAGLSAAIARLIE